MLYEFTNLDVIILSVGPPSQVLIKWQVSNLSSFVNSNYILIIERSMSPKFEESVERFKISHNILPTAVFDFVDTTANLHNLHRRYYYRITAIENNNTFYSDIKTWFGDPDLVAAEIIRRNNLLLEEYTGTPVFILSERTEGPSCECWDEAASRATKSNCIKCFTTGKKYPFFDPIISYVDFNPNPKQTQITRFGELQPMENDVWMSNYPWVKSRDMIIEVENGARWRVVRVHGVHKRRVPLQQMIRISRINLSDIGYKYQLSQDVIEQLKETIDTKRTVKEF